MPAPGTGISKLMQGSRLAQHLWMTPPIGQMVPEDGSKVCYVILDNMPGYKDGERFRKQFPERFQRTIKDRHGEYAAYTKGTDKILQPSYMKKLKKWNHKDANPKPVQWLRDEMQRKGLCWRHFFNKFAIFKMSGHLLKLSWGQHMMQPSLIIKNWRDEFVFIKRMAHDPREKFAEGDPFKERINVLIDTDNGEGACFMWWTWADPDAPIIPKASKEEKS